MTFVTSKDMVEVGATRVVVATENGQMRGTVVDVAKRGNKIKIAYDGYESHPAVIDLDEFPDVVSRSRGRRPGGHNAPKAEVVTAAPKSTRAPKAATVSAVPENSGRKVSGAMLVSQTILGSLKGKLRNFASDPTADGVNDLLATIGGALMAKFVAAEPAKRTRTPKTATVPVAAAPVKPARQPRQSAAPAPVLAPVKPAAKGKAPAAALPTFRVPAGRRPSAPVPMA